MVAESHVIHCGRIISDREDPFAKAALGRNLHLELSSSGSSSIDFSQSSLPHLEPAPLSSLRSEDDARLARASTLSIIGPSRVPKLFFSSTSPITTEPAVSIHSEGTSRKGLLDSFPACSFVAGKDLCLKRESKNILRYRCKFNCRRLFGQRLQKGNRYQLGPITHQ